MAEDERLGHVVLIAHAVPDTLIVPFTMAYTIELISERASRQMRIRRQITSSSTTVAPNAQPTTNPTSSPPLSGATSPLPFTMDAFSGVLSVSGDLDSETQPTYELMIKAVAPDSTVMGSVNITIEISGVACPSGSWSPTGTANCSTHTPCEAGFVEISPPSIFADRVCGVLIIAPAPTTSGDAAGAGGATPSSSTGFIIPLIVSLCLLVVLLLLFVVSRRRRSRDKKDTRGPMAASSGHSNLPSEVAGETLHSVGNPMCATSVPGGMIMGPASRNFDPTYLDHDYEEPGEAVSDYEVPAVSDYEVPVTVKPVAAAGTARRQSARADGPGLYNLAGVNEVADEGYELAQADDDDTDSEETTGASGTIADEETAYELAAAGRVLQLEGTYDLASPSGSSFGLESATSTDGVLTLRVKPREVTYEAAAASACDEVVVNEAMYDLAAKSAKAVTYDVASSVGVMRPAAVYEIGKNYRGAEELMQLPSSDNITYERASDTSIDATYSIDAIMDVAAHASDTIEDDTDGPSAPFLDHEYEYDNVGEDTDEDSDGIDTGGADPADSLIDPVALNQLTEDRAVEILADAMLNFGGPSDTVSSTKSESAAQLGLRTPHTPLAPRLTLGSNLPRRPKADRLLGTVEEGRRLQRHVESPMTSDDDEGTQPSGMVLNVVLDAQQ